jgi:hypothetical protein
VKTCLQIDNEYKRHSDKCIFHDRHQSTRSDVNWIEKLILTHDFPWMNVLHHRLKKLISQVWSSTAYRQRTENYYNDVHIVQLTNVRIHVACSLVNRTAKKDTDDDVEYPSTTFTTSEIRSIELKEQRSLSIEWSMHIHRYPWAIHAFLDGNIPIGVPLSTETSDEYIQSWWCFNRQVYMTICNYGW